MKKISIVGASGYTGKELIKILLNHHLVSISHITSESNSGSKLEDVHPEFRNMTNLVFEKYNLEKIVKDSDIVFLALPHGKSIDIAGQLLKHKKMVIDLSADFRIKDSVMYEKWYKVKHTQKNILEKAVYGLPELYRDKIKKAELIANPGCYATSIILALYPLIKENLININSIVVDSKSGVSGAGKKLDSMYLYNSANENFLPYSVGSHRHTPEIEQILTQESKNNVSITFVPHLTPMYRGIVSDIYADLKDKKMDTEKIYKIYQKYYIKEKFVRLLPIGTYPAVKNVCCTNFCDIGLSVMKNTNKVVVISSIDNLVKGASGQAVQNMNIMCNFDEKMGLL
jgi:N-acetyl-gamma-glutamyl-phosphate reductase